MIQEMLQKAYKNITKILQNLLTFFEKYNILRNENNSKNGGVKLGNR